MLFPPELTIEQIVATLNVVAARWLRRRRRRGHRFAASAERFAIDRLRYHQHRNLAAKRARGLVPQRE